MRGSNRASRQRPTIWPIGATTPARAGAEYAPIGGAGRGPRRLGAPPRRAGGALRIVVLLALLLAVAASVGVWRLGATVTNYAGPHFNQGQNAVWLEHTWAGDAHSSDEFDQLVARLTREQVGYVYAHVGPLDSDGRIPPDRAPYAAALVHILHTQMPKLHVLAWIGQVEAAGGYPSSQSVDLGNSTVRRQIALTAAAMVQTDGFDGVHYDIEPIVNNNPRFLDLLTETQTALPPGAMLSVVGQKWAPNAHAADLLHSVGKGDAWWTSYYYAAVAAHVDQIVAMLYNTAMPSAASYRLAVQQETEHILEATRSASNPPQVLIGLPTYAGNGFWYHDQAENLRSGLDGVIAGLNSNRDTSSFTGVAIYRYASTSDAAWQDYEQRWLGA